MSHTDFAQRSIDTLLQAGDDAAVEVRDQTLQGLRLMASKDLGLVLTYSSVVLPAGVAETPHVAHACKQENTNP